MSGSTSAMAAAELIDAVGAAAAAVSAVSKAREALSAAEAADVTERKKRADEAAAAHKEKIALAKKRANEDDAAIDAAVAESAVEAKALAECAAAAATAAAARNGPLAAPKPLASGALGATGAAARPSGEGKARVVSVIREGDNVRVRISSPPSMVGTTVAAIVSLSAPRNDGLPVISSANLSVDVGEDGFVDVALPVGPQSRDGAARGVRAAASDAVRAARALLGLDSPSSSVVTAIEAAAHACEARDAARAPGFREAKDLLLAELRAKEDAAACAAALRFFRDGVPLEPTPPHGERKAQWRRVRDASHCAPHNTHR
jgi:hypothetical protein